MCCHFFTVNHPAEIIEISFWPGGLYRRNFNDMPEKVTVQRSSLPDHPQILVLHSRYTDIQK
jgi:hypothetical protein